MNPTSDVHHAENGYSTRPWVHKMPLPSPFQPPGLAEVSSPEQWPAAAEKWVDLIRKTQYGLLPPAPAGIRVESLAHCRLSTYPETPNKWTYRVHLEKLRHPFTFTFSVMFPQTKGPFPVILNGDGCWGYLKDSVLQRCLEEGYTVVSFNRTEFAEDLAYDGNPENNKREGGIYELFPEMDFKALSAWAWGYHRTIDALETLPFLDLSKLAVTGHSRGGKTVLLAAATDPRIGVINDNASCAGGSALFRHVGADGESLGAITTNIPSWFLDSFAVYADREETLPFDQHCLLAALAPRPLLLTYSLDDRWSNPEGMVLCAEAAREVYRFLGAGEKIAFHLRQGPHRHHPEDWEALLDFLAVHWRNKSPGRPYNAHPYAHE
ncbi:MAG: hypothetical protein WD708_00225 [Kiritimatiellia bacterium]